MVFFGDCMHNIGDGVAIGVAWATSLGSGLGTSIAIFCHKIPHEFGKANNIKNLTKKKLSYNIIVNLKPLN